MTVSRRSTSTHQCAADAAGGKENLSPELILKGKLQVSQKLRGSVQPSPVKASEQDRQRLAFECRLGTSNDVVQVWCDYVRWAVEKQDPSLSGALSDEAQLLAKACSSLSLDLRHRDDVRHLRLWVRHAGFQPDPRGVFEFLEAKRIGQGHALLYEAWAATLERQHCFEEAEEIYALGIERGAQPAARLRSRQDAFQERMRMREARSSRQGRVGRPGQTPHLGDPSQPPPAVELASRTEPRSAPSRGQRSASPRWRAELRPLPASEERESKIQRLHGHHGEEDVSVEELQAARVLARHAASNANAQHAPDWGAGPSTETHCPWSKANSCARERTPTQEITTSGVRDLLDLDHWPSRRASAASSVFEDPTCTMDLAKQEVLDMLAYDRSHGSQSRGRRLGRSRSGPRTPDRSDSQPLRSLGPDSGSLGGCGSWESSLRFGPTFGTAPGYSLDVFEETAFQDQHRR